MSRKCGAEKSKVRMALNVQIGRPGKEKQVGGWDKRRLSVLSVYIKRPYCK